MHIDTHILYAFCLIVSEGFYVAYTGEIIALVQIWSMSCFPVSNGGGTGYKGFGMSDRHAVIKD